MARVSERTKLVGEGWDQCVWVPGPWLWPWECPESDELELELELELVESLDDEELSDFEPLSLDVVVLDVVPRLSFL